MLLQRRIFQLVLVSLLPVLGLQVYSGVAAYQQRTREVHAETLIHAKTVAQDVQAIIEAAHLAMFSIGQITRKHGTANCSESLTEFKQQYPGITGFGVIDRNGVMRCATIPATVGQNYADWPPFREARQNDHGFTVSAYTSGPISEKAILPLTLPLRDDNGNFDGIVASSIDLAWLSQYLSQRPLPPGSALAIADREGTVAVRLPFFSDAVGKPVPKEIADLLTSKAPSTIEAVVRGVYRIIAYAPLGKSSEGLLVFVGIDKHAALAPVRSAAIRDVALTLLALTLALAAAAVGGRYFIRYPLRNLGNVINRWRGGDITARAQNIRESSEIGRLAVSFNDLADQLANRTSELQSSLQHQKLLVGEVNHRVKNTLAIVQAVALQSFGEKRSVEEVKAVFSERLQAMAEAHNMLSKVEWSGIELHDLASAITAPYRDEDDDPFAISGSAIRLSPSIAVTTAMVLHELCTNAIKYGSLSREGGRVELHWKVEAADFSLSWREVGGPPVTPPERTSFGTRFIRTAFRHEGGSVFYDFLPGGTVLKVRSALENWTIQAAAG